MTDREFLDPRLTERRNKRTIDIDMSEPLMLVDLLNAEDRTVPAAVHDVREELARTVARVSQALRCGGRLVYVGAGTSGRLGVLDAAECPPTFGSEPEMVVARIAGGLDALVRSREGVEDDDGAGAAAVTDLAVGAQDVVIGIAASGTTPYVHGALEAAYARGAATVLVTCADPPPHLTAMLDETILMRVGPEALTGSTRLKAGTATKLVLNTITTGAMIGIGKTYGNLMVDLRAVSEKLRDRSERIVMEVCGVDRSRAATLIEDASGHVKRAIVMQQRNVTPDRADALLDEADGALRRVIGDPPPVVDG